MTISTFTRRAALAGLSVATLAAFAAPVAAQDAVKVGLILPMTGPSASTGRQIEAAVKLYQSMNGTTVYPTPDLRHELRRSPKKESPSRRMSHQQSSDHE